MELWDIYDIDRVRTGRVAQRGKPASEGGLGEGEYHLVVHICVFNGHGQLLLQQRQKDKEGYPNLWDVSAAGSALAGENSAAAASRELREELGIEVRVGRILDAQRIADDGRDLLVLFYSAEIASGEPEPLDCNAVAWAGISELLSYDLAESDRAAALCLNRRP